jgi:phosphonate ABC transporter permease subunit PhnE
MKNNKPNPFRSLKLGLLILLGLVVYAYGFQVTKVNLEETRSERRQEQLFRILRALARPNLFEYQKEEFEVRVQVMIPCPPDGFEPALPEDTTQPYMIVTPSCSEPRTKALVQGFNFEPVTRGPLNLVPYESGVNLQLATIEVDRFGQFEAEVLLPNRPSEEPHEIVAITRRNVGSPQLTRTAYETWDKIVETVFLALLATTLGVLLAIPLSFFAARNLMKEIKSTLTGISLSILLIPIGLYIGAQVANGAEQIKNLMADNWAAVLLCLAAFPPIIARGVSWALPQQEIQTPSFGLRISRLVALFALAFLFVLTLYLLSFTALNAGTILGNAIGSFGFLGFFIRDLGDILNMIITVSVALAGAGVLNGLAGRWSESLNRSKAAFAKPLHFVLAILAGAALALFLLAILHWLYQFKDIDLYRIYAATIGGTLGLLLSLYYKPSDPVSSGLMIYYVSRTIFNTLRSVEALVMAIVFVVWVGIGPFAGSLALALHTIASLAKLYSEQVESIMAGPLEAIQATGANRLQTIIYAVIPQIVPPYISYTMYRWDINVRMSTIIGFVGGGGIGFLLQQNINLLNYRDASAQMLAIAIVVSIMDYISSVMREKVV